MGLDGNQARAHAVEVLEQTEREAQRENLETMRTRIAASIACHAAIKVNTPLDPTSMEWLLAELAKTEHPMSCPHGTTGGVALFDGGYSEGVQEDLAVLSSQFSVLSSQ